MQQSTRKFGQEKEQLAKNYLVSQGLHAIMSNFQCKMGEIDLIMWDKEILVFIEVRYRKQSDHGNGAESVTYHKQRKIIRTAAYYLQTNNLTDKCPCRFDVIIITPSLQSDDLRHPRENGTNLSGTNLNGHRPARRAEGRDIAWSNLKDSYKSRDSCLRGNDGQCKNSDCNSPSIGNQQINWIKDAFWVK